MHGDYVLSVAWNAAGTHIATGCGDGFARVFDVGTGKEIQKLAHGGWVMSVAWNAAGTQLATGCFDQSARVFA